MAADLRHRCSMLFVNVCGAKKARQGALLHRAIGPLKLVSSALWVPNWSSTSCDPGVFVDQAAEPIAASDAKLGR